MLAEFLRQKITAVCPIDGVAIEDPSDKSTWRIDFSASATDAQKAAARNMLATFDLAAAKDSIAHWQQMMPTDEMMARIAEDLIVTLITKGVIVKADLPTLPDGRQPIIEKINARRALRGQQPI